MLSAVGTTTVPWVETARRTIGWLANHALLENAEDFPLYDRVVDEWRRAIDGLGELEEP